MTEKIGRNSRLTKTIHLDGYINYKDTLKSKLMTEKNKAIAFLIVYIGFILVMQFMPFIKHKIKVRRRKKKIDNIRKKKK